MPKMYDEFVQERRGRMPTEAAAVRAVFEQSYDLAEALIQLRDWHGLTQIQLAERGGVNQADIGRIERASMSRQFVHFNALPKPSMLTPGWSSGLPCSCVPQNPLSPVAHQSTERSSFGARRSALAPIHAPSRPRPSGRRHEAFDFCRDRPVQLFHRTERVDRGAEL